MSYHLHAFLILGLFIGLLLGAFACMSAEQVLQLVPNETVLTLAVSGWCSIIFYFARLFYLIRRFQKN